MTARRTPEGWRVENDRPSAGTLAPWEYTHYRARTSKHFLALAPRKPEGRQPDARPREGPGADEARAARRQAARPRARDRRPQQQGHQGADEGPQDAQLARSRSPRPSSTSTGPPSASTDLSGERIFVLWRSYGNRSATERQKVIAHELVHAALAKRTSGRTPPWLYEGIAMYASGDNRSGDAGALISGRGVLRDDSKQKRGEIRDVADEALQSARAAEDVAGVADVRLLLLVRGRLRDRREARRESPAAPATAFNSEKVKRQAWAQAQRQGRPQGPQEVAQRTRVRSRAVRRRETPGSRR